MKLWCRGPEELGGDGGDAGKVQLQCSTGARPDSDGRAGLISRFQGKP